MTVFAGAGLANLAAKFRGHCLEAIANSQDGNSGAENFRINTGRALGINRGGATRKNDRCRILIQHLLGSHRVWHDFGIDASLAHAPSDQLGVLRTKINHQDGAFGNT